MINSLQKFSGFPCLIFPASRSLEKEVTEIENKLSEFLRHWQSHGSTVEGGAAVLENRFVIVAHKPMEISGCSRDDLLFFMRDIGKELGVEWLGAVRIFYRDATGQSVDVDRLEFKKRVQAGDVTPDTLVFDTTLREVDPVLAGKFALPASQSWHMRLMETALKPV